jgi:hypothetical protein
MPRKLLPTKRKKIMSAPEIRLAFISWIPPIFCFKESNKGIDPMISITAKRVKVTVSIASRVI